MHSRVIFSSINQLITQFEIHCFLTRRQPGLQEYRQTDAMKSFTNYELNQAHRTFLYYTTIFRWKADEIIRVFSREPGIVDGTRGNVSGSHCNIVQHSIGCTSRNLFLRLNVCLDRSIWRVLVHGYR